MAVANNSTLRIAINAQILEEGVAGGVEQFVIGLVSALGRLDDGPEEYLIIVHRGNRNWLNSYLGSNQHIVLSPPSKFEAAKQLLGPFRFTVGRLLGRVPSVIKMFPPDRIPVSNGFFESLGVDVIHFPYQTFVRTSIPTVYNPHDLQHIHYPSFFSHSQIAFRELIYRAGCSEAQAVTTDAQWAKQISLGRYGISSAKIYSIPMAPPTEVYTPVSRQMLEDARAKFQLPDIFAFSPAQTWAHKNHIRLLEALALLRDRDHLVVNLVCTGRKNGFWGVIEKRIRELQLENQVRFHGYVTATELLAIYHAAQFAICPSLFEGGGLPGTWKRFIKVCRSCVLNVTSLPEIRG